ncbi:MAG: class I SAM-dependent methyltransferase [Thermodesulfovibrionales bacterium]|nr:class I SAM-dependent methyltransferase [Thermodesulfovibrionales bacterium]
MDNQSNDFLIAQRLYDCNFYEEAGIHYLKALISSKNDVVSILMLAYLYYRFGLTDKFNEIIRLIDSNRLPPVGLYRHLKVLQSGKMLKLQSDFCGDNNLFSKDVITNLYKTYLPEIKSTGLYDDKDFFEKSITRHFDYEILYFFIRLLRPRHVIEFSPQHGLSTVFIYKALQTNNRDFTFATFDIVDSPEFYERMKGYDIKLKITVGDALVTIPDYLKKNGLVGNIDLCFIDCEHTYEFAQQYTRKIMPFLGDNTTYIIHDMCYCPEYPLTRIFHYGDASPNSICGHAGSYGEAECLRMFFKRQKGYRFFLTHKLFGGFGLLSPKIDLNMDLINHLLSEVDGFRYKISNKPNHEDRKIPCLLIAMPENVCEGISSYKVVTRSFLR